MQIRRAPGQQPPDAIRDAVRGRRAIVIRAAGADDAAAIRRLAALAARPVPRGAVIVAVTDEGIVAAHGPDGALADPFRATHDLVELLALRAAQLAA